MADMRVLLLTSLFNTDFFDNALPSKNSAFDSIKRFNCAKRIDRCNVQTLVFLCREIKCLGIPCTKLLEAIFKHQRMHACTYHFQTEAKIWTLELCTLCRYNVITLQKVLCYFFKDVNFLSQVLVYDTIFVVWEQFLSEARILPKFSWIVFAAVNQYLGEQKNPSDWLPLFKHYFFISF
jgi:hypothetical protein